MSNEHNIDQKEDGEITLKELLIKIKGFYKEILKSWILLLLITIPCIAYFLNDAISTPTSYPAELSFMVNEDEGGSIGGAMSILSQIGLGGGGGGGKFNLKKILKLSKTRHLVQLVFFETSLINNEEDYLANHIIKIYDLHENWENSPIGLEGFTFSHDDVEKFDSIENAALKRVHSVVVGSASRVGFFNSVLEKETSIMEFKVNTLSEKLSIDWLNQTYEHLSKYYIDKSIEKQKFTYNVISQKVDSINTKLRSSEFRLAKFMDSNRKLYTKTASLEELRLKRDIQMLSIMYGEALKNLELAEFSLKSKTPFFQLIDPPIAPIDPVNKSKIKAIIIGGIVGGFLAALIIIGRKILRDTME